MSEKVLICPYFGEQPPWMDRFWENAERLQEHGYDFLLEDDEDAFRDRVRDKLGVVAPPMANTGKVWDYRPALGLLYADEIAGFDYFGHCDFDVVFGRVEYFVTDDKLAVCDIFTDCQYDYIAGPFSLYRNEPRVRDLFLSSPEWIVNLECAEPTAWQETFFSVLALKRLRVTVENHHGFGDTSELHWDGERLMVGGREVSHFHFNRTKSVGGWPL